MIVLIQLELFPGELSKPFLPRAFSFSQNFAVPLRMSMGLEIASLSWPAMGHKLTSGHPLAHCHAAQ